MQTLLVCNTEWFRMYCFFDCVIYDDESGVKVEGKTATVCKYCVTDVAHDSLNRSSVLPHLQRHPASDSPSLFYVGLGQIKIKSPLPI